MNKELIRLVRHLVAPLIAYLVTAGYLPEALQGQVTEFVLMGVGVAVALTFSWTRDQKKG